MLNNHPLLMDAAAFVYNSFHRNNAWKHRKAVECRGSFFNHVDFRVVGKNSRIVIGRKARLKNCQIYVFGDNCLLEIGGGSTKISNTCFYLEDDNSKIVIGRDFTMEGGHIASTEGETIKIGDDCMFSNDIEIRNGDSHSIVDASTGKRTNWAKTVEIGNHVWLTAHARVLKGGGNSGPLGNLQQLRGCKQAGQPQRHIWRHTRKAAKDGHRLEQGQIQIQKMTEWEALQY